MAGSRLIHVSVFPGWIVGITYDRGSGYRCWVISPDMTVLHDDEIYASSQDALSAGRLYIHHAMGVEPDYGGRG